MQMKKYIKHIFTISMLLLLFTSQAYACRLMGAIALNGTRFPQPVNDQTNTTLGLFNTFRSQSTSFNDNGWGFAYYYKERGTQTGLGRIWPGNTVSDRYACSEQASTCTHYDTSARYPIQNTRPSIIIGHLRNASNPATQNRPDPHPFIYKAEDNSHYLTFAHNGTIDGGSTYPFTSYSTCDTWKNQVITYATQVSDANLLALANSDIDSGIYFAYLIMHIKQNGWDILRGLNSALNGVSPSSSGTTGFNFVMSDGKDMYAYRNSVLNTNTGYDQVSGKLYYLVLSNYVVSPYLTHNLAFVATDFTNGPTQTLTSTYLTVPGFNNTPIKDYIKEFEDDELIYFPGQGKMVSIKNFSQQSNKLHTKVTNPLTSGQRRVWNWESFPVMQGNAHDALNTLKQPTGNNLYSGFGFEHLMKGYNYNGHYVNKDISGWSYPLGSFYIEPRRGYKLQSSGLDEVKVKGSLCANTGFGQMEVGPVYWVGYWLMNSQSLREALGANFSNVRRVWAENWYYDNMELEQKTGIVNPLNADYPMEFGKMYAIQLSQNASPITNFKWENSRKPAERSLNRTASFFTYDQAESYEAIDILSVSKNSMNYQEIGVFDGETCIGATALDQFPVQILAYTQGREGHPLTFRALNENGAVSEINPVTSAYDSKSGSFQPKLLVAGEIEYAILNIEEKSDDVNSTLPTVLSNSVNYPNPFNPVTNISFTLSKTDRVVVNIYNIKGQLVNSLFDGQLNAGKHFIRWDGKDNDKKSLASGVYFYNIISGNNNITKKMIMMK